jgi:hypothetical protein
VDAKVDQEKNDSVEHFWAHGGDAESGANLCRANEGLKEAHVDVGDVNEGNVRVHDVDGTVLEEEEIVPQCKCKWHLKVDPNSQIFVLLNVMSIYN